MPTHRFDTVHPLGLAHNDVTPSFYRHGGDMKDAEAMKYETFGGAHVPPLFVECRRHMREHRARMYEVGPMRCNEFKRILRHDDYPMFRRFDEIRLNRTANMQSGNKKRGEAFQDIWRNCCAWGMVVVKLMTLQMFDIPYSFYGEQVRGALCVKRSRTKERCSMVRI